MIWYLLDAFNQMEREDNKFKITDISRSKWKYLWAIIITSILLFITIAIIPMLYDIYWIGGIAIIVYFAIYIYSIKEISKETEKEYEKNTKAYKETLENLSHILRKEVFRLYTEKQILKLIDDCNQILPSLQRSKSIFQPIVTLFTVILFPIITLALNILIENLTFNMSMQIMIVILLGLLYLISVYYLISPIVGGILDSDFKKLRRIRDMLSDIILIEFTK
jgi:hypothetical protein